MQWREQGIRLLVHLLLAFFLANAANKFFVADLEAEFATGFYHRIFAGVGDAPDQYRILPLLPLQALCTQLPFNTAVLIYNFVLAFVFFELLWRLRPDWSAKRRFGLHMLLGLLYIYCQYTGWRPDTMGLLVVAAAATLAAGAAREKLRLPVILVGVAALAFCRADVALVFGVFFSFRYLTTWPLRLLVLLVPVAVQIGLQLGLFPDAVYYSKTLMLADNLSGYYFIRNPFSWMLIAAGIVYRQEILAFVRGTFWNNRYFYGAMAGYLVLVLVVGRLNEYRLYLPFVPLFIALESRNGSAQSEETGTV